MPATEKMPKLSARRPSTCTMPRSWSISALARGVPSGLTRGTTSVLMASATTSCSTTPMTVSSEATTNSMSGAHPGNQLPAAPASRTKLTATSPAPANT